MSETAENRIKRLAMRARLRGMREMDLVLGPYAAERLAGMDADALNLFEDLLAENDQELLAWVLGQEVPPPRYAALMAELTAEARNRHGAPR